MLWKMKETNIYQYFFWLEFLKLHQVNNKWEEIPLYTHWFEFAHSDECLVKEITMNSAVIWTIGC